MFLDPLQDDGLPEEDREIQFDFDERRDYAKELDAIQPPWRGVWAPNPESKGASFSNTTTPIEMKVGKKQTRTIPQFRYVRAVDPAGNIVPLSVSTCRPSPEFPDGNDRIGTRARVIESKHRRGWIIIDLDDQASRCPESKYMLGPQYIAWALAVSASRKQRHTKYENSEAELFMSQKRAEAKMRADEMAQANKAIMGEMGREVGREVAKALDRAERKGGKDRAERAE